MKAKYGKLILAVLFLILIITGFSFYSIFNETKTVADHALADFGPPTVPALITAAQSTDWPFEQRNKAVWALGQIGDRRALEPLMELNRTTPENEKDSTQHLVKYTLEKSIRQLNSRLIVTRWMYRFL